MTTKLMIGIACVAGCVDTDELGETTQATTAYSDKCYGCGANGESQGMWNAMFNQADRNALNGYSAWDWGSDGPKSLCDPNRTYASYCWMRQEWSNWIAGGGGVRIGMIDHIIQVAAQKHYEVRDPQGNWYYGEFGLAHRALSNSWNYADQELVTAGTLALLNAVQGVAVCLKSERNPAACSGSGAIYFEATFFGNTFRPHWAAISGGTHAPNPHENLRYGSVDGNSATVYQHNEQTCAVTGSGENTLATSCAGGTWNWPVVVLTPGRPSDWYYNTGGVVREKPPSFPAL
jgi:hypothetical protein